ncbi:hypothetical protein [Bartonella apis]|uniref:hypothetical protein n=1 Tax=Bartonella apis TaxID=1686310 RepID=UPI003BB4B85D
MSRKRMLGGAKSSSATSGIAMLGDVMPSGAISRKVMSDGGMSGSMKFRAG